MGRCELSSYTRALSDRVAGDIAISRSCTFNLASEAALSRLNKMCIPVHHQLIHHSCFSQFITSSSVVAFGVDDLFMVYNLVSERGWGREGALEGTREETSWKLDGRAGRGRVA